MILHILLKTTLLLLFVTSSQAQIGAFNCTSMLNEGPPHVGFRQQNNKKRCALYTGASYTQRFTVVVFSKINRKNNLIEGTFSGRLHATKLYSLSHEHATSACLSAAVQTHFDNIWALKCMSFISFVQQRLVIQLISFMIPHWERLHLLLK